MTWQRPRPLATPPDALALSADEQRVLSRIDGRTTVDDLAAATGLGPATVAQIVAHLADLGAVALEADDERMESAAAAEDDAFADTAAGETAGDTADESAGEAAGETAGEAAGESDEATDAVHAERETTYRQRFELAWRAVPTDARVAAAQTARGDDLVALCFDPEPRVLAALFANPLAGLEHARLVAAHHRTATGLELLARRPEWLRDARVERRLLRNPQLGETVLQRVLGPKRLRAAWQLAMDRELPETTRLRARASLRQKFHAAPPDERAELVLRTEGRCLVALAGCTFDARTTQMLARHPAHSVLLVQNLAKFSATPPALLAHLFKQPLVRRNPALRRLLQQHANMPGELKRAT